MVDRLLGLRPDPRTAVARVRAAALPGRARNRCATRLGSSIGWGADSSSCCRSASVLLLVTVVGIPLGLFLLLALAFIYTLGYAVATMAAGNMIMRSSSSRFVVFLVGWVVLRVLALIPFVGGWLWFLGSVWGLGLLAVAIRSRGVDRRVVPRRRRRCRPRRSARPEARPAAKYPPRVAVEERARPSGAARVTKLPLQGRVRLVVLSALMLFVELVLIRWPAENNIYLRYLTNLVLLASFLGVGVGFLRASAKRDLFPYAPIALALFALFVVLFPVQQVRIGDASGASRARGSARPPGLGVVAAGVRGSRGRHGADRRGGCADVPDVRCPAGISARRARQHRRDRRIQPAGVPRDAPGRVDPARLYRIPLRARSADPTRAGRRARRSGADLRRELALGTRRVVALLQGHDDRAGDGKDRPARERARPSVDVSTGLLRVQQPFYDYVYAHLPPGPLDRVLVVGAGSGNDVAVALDHGARHVDAVEIDPVLQARGMELHPGEPVRRPTRGTSHRRRTGVPRTHRRSLRPDRVRAP